jgi:hypothetical protein
MKCFPKYALYIAGVTSRIPKLQRDKIRSKSKVKSRADPSRTPPQIKLIPSIKFKAFLSFTNTHPFHG